MRIKNVAHCGICGELMVAYGEFALWRHVSERQPRAGMLDPCRKVEPSYSKDHQGEFWGTTPHREVVA